MPFSNLQPLFTRIMTLAKLEATLENSTNTFTISADHKVENPTQYTKFHPMTPTVYLPPFTNPRIKSDVQPLGHKH